jgi:hypothetical protein
MQTHKLLKRDIQSKCLVSQGFLVFSLHYTFYWNSVNPIGFLWLINSVLCCECPEIKIRIEAQQFPVCGEEVIT